MLGSFDKTDEDEKKEAWVPTKLNWTVFPVRSRFCSTIKIYLSIASCIVNGTEI